MCDRIMLVVGLILLDAHFYSCYKNVNYCKIANNIIKTTILSDSSKHFLDCIYVTKILFFTFVEKILFKNKVICQYIGKLLLLFSCAKKSSHKY